MRLLSLSLLTSLAFGLFAAPVAAQPSPEKAKLETKAGEPGFTITGENNKSAGEICSGFECKGGAISIAPLERFTFTIRSPFGSPYMLLAGSQHFLNCIPYPGIGNLWAGPQYPLVMGKVDKPDPLPCWGGVTSFSLYGPTHVPMGTRLVFQVVVENLQNGVKGPVFSTPVQLTLKLSTA